MAKSDIFMHAGHLQFRRKSWHHRNYIWLDSQPHLLTIPIERPSLRPIRDVWFKDDHWKKDHLGTIALAYGNAPFFDDYYPPLKEIIYYHPHSLERLNIELTTLVARWLGIRTTIVDGAQWDLPPKKKDPVGMILQMCTAVEANAYLSNEGSKVYITPLEEVRMRKEGVMHQWLEFDDPDPQPLAAIHHLFMLGPDAEGLIR